MSFPQIIADLAPITSSNFRVQGALRVLAGESREAVQAEIKAACSWGDLLSVAEIDFLRGPLSDLEAAMERASTRNYYNKAAWEVVVDAHKAIYGDPRKVVAAPVIVAPVVAATPVSTPAETFQSIEARRIAAVQNNNDYAVQEAHQASQRIQNRNSRAWREANHEEE